MTDQDVKRRLDALERENVDLRSQLDRLSRDTRAAVDQAKHAIRKLDQVRMVLDDTTTIGKSPVA